MTDLRPGPTPVDAQLVALARDVAAHVEDYLSALQAIARDGDAGSSVPLLRPEQEYQPYVGPEADLDELRLRLAQILGGVDTYSFVFDPYRPEVVESQLSDDLVAIASDLENGMRHLRDGNVAEALWWWQFSYVSSWGNLAGAALNALWSIVHHDRLDTDVTVDEDQVEAADEILGRAESPAQSPAESDPETPSAEMPPGSATAPR
jgi:hypothetical protein